MSHNYGNATRFIFSMQYAMLILHDECIKKYPPQGTLLGSSKHSAEELDNTPTSTLLGNSTAAGERTTLTGDDLR